MLCTTVRKENECVFMKKKGCSYEGGSCLSIVEKCEGCKRITEFESEKYCLSAPDPYVKWKYGICNMATHVKVTVEKTKQKINPIKASKRGH